MCGSRIHASHQKSTGKRLRSPLLTLPRASIGTFLSPARRPRSLVCLIRSHVYCDSGTKNQAVGAAPRRPAGPSIKSASAPHVDKASRHDPNEGRAYRIHSGSIDSLVPVLYDPSGREHTQSLQVIDRSIDCSRPTPASLSRSNTSDYTLRYARWLHLDYVQLAFPAHKGVGVGDIFRRRQEPIRRQRVPSGSHSLKAEEEEDKTAERVDPQFRRQGQAKRRAFEDRCSLHRPVSKGHKAISSQACS